MGKELSPKARRAEIARKQLTLQQAVTTLFVSLSLLGAGEEIEVWLAEEKSFPDFLRRFARQHFGEKDDVSESWEQRVCQIISDIADREMTEKERKRRDISTPRLIVEWFADFLEALYPKPKMAWSSPLFAKEATDPYMNRLKLGLGMPSGS